MARSPKSPKSSKQVDALKHEAASRRNIPTAEMESFFRRDEDATPMPPKHYPRARPLAEGETRTAEEPRVPELIWNGARITITDEQMKELAATGTLTLSDAQLVWRGKDRQDWSDLVVNVPPLYIQEKIKPQAIIADLRRRTAEMREGQTEAPDMFADFNGLPKDWIEDGFYKHDGHWSNRMILGDSLQVMASLAERESLRGKVQCIYFDPPYGIRFNSNWQVSTLSRDVKDGKQVDISREPEQVKAFRDTWKDGIHSYLTYLRDRLTVMRDLLTESGSIFVQISDENVHRVRAVFDEVFGSEGFCAEIAFSKATGLTSELVPSVFDYILWYSRDRKRIKFRPLFRERDFEADRLGEFRNTDPILGDDPKASAYRTNSAVSPGIRANTTGKFSYLSLNFDSGPTRNWKTILPGMKRLAMAGRLEFEASPSRMYKQYWKDFSHLPFTNIWSDVRSEQDRIYVVQTVERVIQRCMLMTNHLYHELRSLCGACSRRDFEPPH